MPRRIHIPKSRLSSFGALIFALLFAIPELSFAQVEQVGSCNINLRVVGADVPFDPQAGKRARKIAPELSDIAAQLESIRFAEFKLREQQAQQLKVRQAGEFSFTSNEGDKQTLHLVPVYVTRFNVKLVLDWQDSGGETLLATQLRIPTGQALVVGADDKEARGTVLVIKLECF